MALRLEAVLGYRAKYGPEDERTPVDRRCNTLHGLGGFSIVIERFHGPMPIVPNNCDIHIEWLNQPTGTTQNFAGFPVRHPDFRFSAAPPVDETLMRRHATVLHARAHDTRFAHLPDG